MPERQAAPSAGRLAFADGLRGLAALWVLLFHLAKGHHLDALQAGLPPAVDRVVFEWGHGGVAVFFVLSGCVLALTVERLVLDPAGAGRFVLRRFVRLAPPYYAAVLVAVGLGLAKGATFSAGQLASHALFLQTLLGYPPLSVVFWTLCIEIQFYVAFAAITWLADALGARARTTSRIVIAALSLAWPLGLFETSVQSGSFLPFWVHFMAGVLVWDALRGRTASRIAAISMAAVLLAVGIARHDLYSGVAGCTSLALVAAHAVGGLHRWLSDRIAQALGRVSYSLYLLHVPTLAVTAHVLHRVLPGDGIAIELAGAAICLCACAAVAWLFWLLVERPGIRWSHALARTRPR